jgi:hypothetical protein
MRSLGRGLLSVAKWLLFAAIIVEICSFLAIILSNYWIYGQLHDGDPVRYDPYAIFVTAGYPRPTHHNAALENGKVKVIWMFGGSTMSGATSFDDRTIPSFLAGNLNREEPQLPAYIINYGEPSYNSLMETKYLQKELIENPTAPDVVMFYDGANDATYFAQTRRASGGHLGLDKLQGLIESYHYSFFGLLKPLNAALYASYTHELYDKLRQGVISISADDQELQRFVDHAERRYDYVSRTVTAAGARFCLFWQPAWWVETGPVAPGVKQQEAREIIIGQHFALRHNFEVINLALVKRLRDKPYFVDVQNVLCPRTEPVYQSDGIHLLDGGRKMVAARMGQLLRRQSQGSAAAVGGAQR